MTCQNSSAKSKEKGVKTVTVNFEIDALSSMVTKVPEIKNISTSEEEENSSRNIVS